MAKNSKRNSRALVPSVVEAELDLALVDETVDWIREKIAHTVFKGALEIGAHIFNRFFDGDPALVSSTSPKKGASFRALAARCAEDPQIKMSKSALHRAVSIAAIASHLPANASFRQLAPSHQSALLPIHDPEKIERLARTVLTKELSVPAVNELVKEKKKVPVGERRGRPPRSRILRALGGLLRAFSIAGGKKPFTTAEVDELDSGELAIALETAKSLADRLDNLLKQLKKASRR